MWAVENIFPLDFAKYSHYSEVQSNSKVATIRSGFRKKGVCFKSVTKTLYIGTSFWHVNSF